MAASRTTKSSTTKSAKKRVKVKDLPAGTKLGKKEMKKVKGGIIAILIGGVTPKRP